jgi:hypothetical protein
MTMLTASYTQARSAADARIEDLISEYRVALADRSLSRHERRDTAISIALLLRWLTA